MALTKAARALRELVTPPIRPQYTQQQLAAKLGVTQQAVSQWLRGHSRPTDETRLKIEALVGIPAVDWLRVALSEESVAVAIDDAEMPPPPTGSDDA